MNIDVAIMAAKRVMTRRFLADFFYYLRLGYGFRKSWRLARVTL